MILRLRALSAVLILCHCAAGASVAAEPVNNQSTRERLVAVGQLARTTGAQDKGLDYVLLDESNEILNFIQSAPGVHLANYVGQEVGITASQLTGGPTPVLLAEGVTSLNAPSIVAARHPTSVALTSHEEQLLGPTAPAMMGGPAVAIPPDFAVGRGPSGTLPYGGSACSGGCGNLNCDRCVACPCGPTGEYWVSAEYLLWWTKGMQTPPLVTTSPVGTPQADAGVLGADGTSVLFGGQKLFDEDRSGGRFRLGKWCDQCQWIGFDFEYLFLGEESASYRECSVGLPILARPFFNVVRDEQDSELVQFPGVLVGTVHVDAESNFYSLSPRFRINLACEGATSCNSCNDCGPGRSYRYDLLLGYRYLRLDDDLRIRESLSTVDPETQTLFDLRDSFETTNDFHGLDLGILWEGYRGPWNLELVGRLGLGNNREAVRINGSTQTSTASGASFSDPGGLLALPSNIGGYRRDKFAVVPEFGATVGYAFTPRLRCTFGYTFLYWNKVVRAAEQIDVGVNPNLLPPALENPGPLRPDFAFNDTSFWAQGLNFGLNYRW